MAKILKPKDMSTPEQRIKHKGAQELIDRFFDVFHLIAKKYPDKYQQLNATKVSCMVERMNMLYQAENEGFDDPKLNKNWSIWKKSDEEVARHLLTWVHLLNGKDTKE